MTMKRRYHRYVDEGKGERTLEEDLRREVTDYLLRVMRGEEAGTTASMKAAEMLVKCLTMTNESAEGVPVPVIIDDVREEKR